MEDNTETENKGNKLRYFVQEIKKNRRFHGKENQFPSSLDKAHF
jgi:hypothetical protein